MSLIAYLPKNDEAGRRIQRLVGELTSQDSIEIFYTIPGLDHRLRNFPGNGDITLLLASTPKDLNELLDRRDLFNSRRVVLIVPDREKGTLSKGHLLRPRYVGFRDDHNLDLAMVLEKMLKIASLNPHLTQ